MGIRFLFENHKYEQNMKNLRNLKTWFLILLY